MQVVTDLKDQAEEWHDENIPDQDFCGLLF